MKKTELLQYIGEIDDKYIAECDKAMAPKAEARSVWGGAMWRRAAVLLAVLVVFFTSVITVEAIRPNQPLLRYEKQNNNWYGFWVLTHMLEDPAPDELETIYTPAALPEKFHLVHRRPGGQMDNYGNWITETYMEQRWETWEGHAVTLRQRTFSVSSSRTPSSGTWETVRIGEYVGYRSKWDQNDVLVWVTNEYLFILQLEGESAVALDAVALAESLVPEDSLKNPDGEKEYKDLNLTFDPKWNYQTICRNACLDAGRLYFNPDFLAEVPEAAQYEGKYGAISVWTADNPDGPQELWILWEDYTITYLHTTEEAFREKYQHSKEPELIVEPSWGFDDAPPLHEYDYFVNDKWQAREEQLMRWRCWDALLKDQKAEWLFGNGPTANGSYGMLMTDGTLIYFPTPTYAIEMYTGKPDTAHNSKTEYISLKAQAGEYFIASAGQNRVQLRYGVEEIRRLGNGSLLRRNLWSNGEKIVQAADYVILKTDGRLEIKSNMEIRPGMEYKTDLEIQMLYRALDEQYVRIFPEAGYGLTVDNRLVRYAEFVDGPDEITLKEGGEVDQVTQELVVVYKDGTLQYPADVPELEWLSAVEKVRVLSTIFLKAHPSVPEINTVPVPEGT